MRESTREREGECVCERDRQPRFSMSDKEGEGATQMFFFFFSFSFLCKIKRLNRLTACTSLFIHACKSLSFSQQKVQPRNGVRISNECAGADLSRTEGDTMDITRERSMRLRWFIMWPYVRSGRFFSLS